MLSRVVQRYLFRHRITYSRKYLEELSIDREAIAREEAKQAELRKKETILNMKGNDRNEKNYVQLRINHPLLRVNPIKEINQSRGVPEILEAPIKLFKPEMTISAIRKYIISSIYKAKIALHCIRHKHILDAINELKHSDKKVAKLMLPTLYNLIAHAGDRQINPLFLFVHGYIIGKTRRWKITRYHAKGRGAQGKKDQIQVRIILKVKNEQEFFMDAVSGKCPPAFANLVRQLLINKDKDLETITKFTGITTAKGRQQNREIQKRKVRAWMVENEAKGEFLMKKELEFYVATNEAAKLMQNFNNLIKEDNTKVLREKLFKKNMEEEGK